MRYTWCNSGIPAGISAKKRYNYCSLWKCQCDHYIAAHSLKSNTNKCWFKGCLCLKFYFQSNDECTIECQFQRKVYESDEIERVKRKSEANLKKRLRK